MYLISKSYKWNFILPYSSENKQPIFAIRLLNTDPRSAAIVTLPLLSMSKRLVMLAPKPVLPMMAPPSPLTVVKKVGPDLNGHRLLLRVNPDIARALKEEESAVLKDLRQSIGKDVTIKSDTHLHHEQFDVMAV